MQMERLWDEHDSAFHSHQLLKIPFLERQDALYGDFSPNRTGAHYGKAASHEWPHIFFIHRRLRQNKENSLDSFSPGANGGNHPLVFSPVDSVPVSFVHRRSSRLAGCRDDYALLIISVILE
jgi:hypothetical protein